MIFGPCQNHQNKTFKRPNKSRFEKYFYAKMNTTLLLYLYQIFIFLLGHLHFFLHFIFSFMENLSKKHPIFLSKFSSYLVIIKIVKILHQLGHISYKNHDMKMIFYQKKYYIDIVDVCIR